MANGKKGRDGAGEPSASDNLGEALGAVRRELEAWNSDNSPSDTGREVEDVPAGHSLHRAIAALERFYGGRLPEPAISHWGTFLRLARGGDEAAADVAHWLREWAADEIAAHERTEAMLKEIGREPPHAWWADPVEPVGDVAAIMARVEQARRLWIEADKIPPGDLSRATGHDSPPQAIIDKLWEAMLATGKTTPARPKLPPHAFDGRSTDDLWGEYHAALNAASAWCEAQLAAEAANRPTPEDAGGKDTKPPGAAGDKLRAAVHTKKPKRSTERGEGRTKLIAALTKHHKYASGGCLNLEPIGNNELARQAGVSESTASAFFRKEFGGHMKYRAACGDSTRLVTAIKLLNQEFSPHHLFGRTPPGEDERGDEE